MLKHCLAGLLVLAWVVPVLAVPPGAPEVESCAAIRARIGVAPQADGDLLRTLAARQDCGFSAQEVYRAAHGDRPWPRHEAAEGRVRRNEHESRDRHDDDD